ncbi:MAG: hypothetical protein JEY71_00640 [Sphaerochaeta sp.]|nr:hypothetical protein [Sphaerochaeta sp.]
MPIVFHRKKTMRTLTCISCVLIVLSILTKISTFVFGHGYIYGFLPKFDLDKEANIPTVFAVLLLFVASLLFYMMSLIPEKQPIPKQDPKSHYRFLSLLFLYLAFDEGSSIHELMIDPLRDRFHLTGIFRFSWVIVGIILVALLILYFYRFILSRPTYMKKGFILAGMIFIGGALGVEMIGGYYSSVYGELNLTYGLITIVEESGEFFGCLVLINTLLQGIQNSLPNSTLSIDLHD